MFLIFIQQSFFPSFSILSKTKIISKNFFFIKDCCIPHQILSLLDLELRKASFLEITWQLSMIVNSFKYTAVCAIHSYLHRVRFACYVFEVCEAFKKREKKMLQDKFHTYYTVCSLVWLIRFYLRADDYSICTLQSEISGIRTFLDAWPKNTPIFK